MMSPEEQKILRNLKDENSKNRAFNDLVNLYKQRLYWHIRKIVISHDDADDVLQNTFLKVWKSIDNFRSEAGLYTWLYRIATNEALSFLKQKQKRSILPLNDVSEYLVETLKAENHFSGDEIQQKFQEAIIRLPEKQRLVFNMKYYDDIKYQDMSKILDTSEGALKASYHHAVKKIEEFMRNQA
ncbi:RNA polymerase sigma factor [Puteibacter caeruleilacunae]|nr:RNA polymerase sigma factor [Puteibacter caeruleilacunae]